VQVNQDEEQAMQSGDTLDLNQLLGAWQLRSWQIHNPTHDSSLYPFGEDAQGLLIYSPTGLVSASISQAQHVVWSGKPSNDDLAAAYKSQLHYVARFSLRGNCVTHAVQMSSNPALIGHAHSRQIHIIDAQTLRYEGVDHPGTSAERRHTFIWRRLPAHPPQ
jgi:hypothetical protein